MTTRFLPRGLDAFPRTLGPTRGNKHDFLILVVADILTVPLPGREQISLPDQVISSAPSPCSPL